MKKTYILLSLLLTFSLLGKEYKLSKEESQLLLFEQFDKNSWNKALSELPELFKVEDKNNYGFPSLGKLYRHYEKIKNLSKHPYCILKTKLSKKWINQVIKLSESSFKLMGRTSVPGVISNKKSLLLTQKNFYKLRDSLLSYMEKPVMASKEILDKLKSEKRMQDKAFNKLVKKINKAFRIKKKKKNLKIIILEKESDDKWTPFELTEDDFNYFVENYNKKYDDSSKK